MPPFQKIVGYLFGLPSREYFMFALTLPFVVWASWVGGVPVWKLAVLYSMFFITVWLYHLTGMVAGLFSKKPWRVQVLSQGLVLCLYIIMPVISYTGFTFLEFLTVRPTIYVMVLEELARYEQMSGDVMSRLDRMREVSFFNETLHPLVMSLAVQGFALVSLYLAASRKWADERRLAMSKSYAIIFCAVVMFFILGSIWPMLKLNANYPEALRVLLREAREQDSLVLFVVLAAMGLVSATVCIGIVSFLITPRYHVMVMGCRRAHKLGLKHVPRGLDPASSLPPIAVALVLMGVMYAVLVGVTSRTGHFENTTLSGVGVALPAVYLASVVLFLRALWERFTVALAGVVIFVLVMLPVMVAILLVAVWDRYLGAAFMLISFPPFGLYLTFANLVEPTLMASSQKTGYEMSLIAPPIRDSFGVLLMLAVGFYSVGAVAFEAHLFGWRKRMFEKERHGSQPTAASLATTQDEAAS